MKEKRSFFVTCVALFAVLILLSMGCATRRYVDTQVGILEGKIGENTANIAALNADVDALKTSVQGNSENIAALKADVSALGDLAGRVESLEDAVSSLKDSRVVKRVAVDEQVFFDFDKWILTDEAKAILDKLAAEIGKMGYDQIVVAGHADSVGTTKYNLSLGLRRAQMVAAYLGGTAGLDRHRITVASFGEEIPILSNDTPEGRAKNRRVEIVVYKAALAPGGELVSSTSPQ